MIPVEVEDSALSQQVVVTFGVREWCEDSELREVEVNLTKEVDESFDVVFGLVVEAEQNRAFHSDAVVVVAFHTFFDVIRCVVDGLIHVPSASFCCQIEHFGVVFDGVAYPFLLQRRDGGEELFLPFFVLCQRVIDDKQTVVVDACHVFHHLVDWTRAELTSTEVGNCAWITAEAAAAARVEEVDHLHALVVVEVTFVEVATTWSHALDRRLVAHEVVDFLETSVLPVEDDLLGATFRLAQKHAVDMIHHLLGVKHGRDAAGKDFLATFVILVGDSPAAFDLRGEHHRESHNVAFLIKINGFHVLVGKRNVDILRQGSGKSHRPVRRKIERSLPRKLVPFRVNQFQLYSFHIKTILLMQTTKIRKLFYLQRIFDFFNYFVMSDKRFGGLDGSNRHAAEAMDVDILPGEVEVLNLSKH